MFWWNKRLSQQVQLHITSGTGSPSQSIIRYVLKLPPNPTSFTTSLPPLPALLLSFVICIDRSAEDTKRDDVITLSTIGMHLQQSWTSMYLLSIIFLLFWAVINRIYHLDYILIGKSEAFCSRFMFLVDRKRKGINRSIRGLRVCCSIIMDESRELFWTSSLTSATRRPNCGL